MATPETLKKIITQLIATHGDVKTLAASSSISAITWLRWAEVTQEPRSKSKALAAKAFAAAGMVSPWNVQQEPHRQEVVAPSLFDLETFEVVEFKPAVWSGLAKPVVESLADAAFCCYSIEEDRGSKVVLRDKSVQGGTLTTWRTVAYPTQSYALRLPDGRLVEFIQGSSISLHEDSEARRAARGPQTYRRVA